LAHKIAIYPLAARTHGRLFFSAGLFQPVTGATGAQKIAVKTAPDLVLVEHRM